jgi:hypothetical protein
VAVCDPVAVTIRDSRARIRVVGEFTAFTAGSLMKLGSPVTAVLPAIHAMPNTASLEFVVDPLVEIETAVVEAPPESALPD